MKTLLISPMWLDYPEAMRRHEKWLDFMLPLKNELGFTDIFFADNASSEHRLWSLQKKYGFLYHRSKVHVARREHLKYGYWYAALAIASRHALNNSYEKIIYIDTDMYPLSKRICEYVKALDYGWTGMYCHRHNFPETNFQIIGKDKLQDFHDFHSRDFLKFYPDLDAESQTPFTKVEKGFVGDRYGEFNDGKGLDQAPEHDYYAQCPITKDLKFEL